MNDMSTLRETVESIRKARYANLSRELVQEIIEIESSYLEDQATALRRINDVINRYLTKKERA